MSLWKYSFELVNRELDLTKKKKQALDNLLASNKISKSTHDSLKMELAEAIAELEDHLKTIMEKMTARGQELENQISTLELFLASLEIHHAAGDVDEQTYEQQNNAIFLGLEATKQELNDIRTSLSKSSESAEEKVATREPEQIIAGTEEVTEPTEAEGEEKIQLEEQEEPSEFETLEPAEPSSDLT